MEHHYSLTGRMLAIFVGGLILLAILVFAAGLLAGREWGANEATERLGPAQRNRISPAPPQAPQAAVPTAPAASGTAASGGAIRPPDALPPPPAVPAAPALPALPKAPSVPALPLPPPAKSSGAREIRGTELARLPDEASERRPTKRASAAAARKEGAARGDSEIHGYVVYVGAFENSAKADDLVEALRRRNLVAQTSAVEKPGRKPLLAVWVGPFGARAGAVAVLPVIRDAGVNDAVVRAVP